MTVDALQHGKAHRDALFRRYVDLRRLAEGSEDQADHQQVAEAYRDFLRSHLARDERAILDLEDEITRLRAEVARLRRLHTGAAA
ncbi:DUF837 domain-containing protein [Methylobacterium oryzisoli]|uniref:DUF837 domain-containing protein n=1 Tax=Methylobacterium oryzisoli TaxID=3385502 RepID=UPI003892600A